MEGSPAKSTAISSQPKSCLAKSGCMRLPSADVFTMHLREKYPMLILPYLFSLQMATCFVSSNGLKVTVEQAKCVQANAFIQSTLFQQFTFLPDAPAVFRINLTALIVSVEAAASFPVLSLAQSQALSQQTSFQAHSPFLECSEYCMEEQEQCHPIKLQGF